MGDGSLRGQIELLKYKGDDLAKRGYHVEAAEIYSDAINLANTDSRLFVNRGACQYQLGNYEAALQDADKALEISPKSVIAIANKIDVLEKLGGSSDAEKLFSQACAMFPGFMDFFEKDACNRRTFDTHGAAFEELVLEHQQAPWWKRAYRSAVGWYSAPRTTTKDDDDNKGNNTQDIETDDGPMIVAQENDAKEEEIVDRSDAVGPKGVHRRRANAK